MSLSRVLVYLHRLGGRPGGAESDGALLERFVARREEAAFAGLLGRHGPMVLGVCRRVLGNSEDAEDSFQATFLLLARKAASIRRRDSVGSWLHGAAYRIATRARAERHRRQVREREAGRRPAETPGFDAAWRELQAVLDEELGRLPDKYRDPLLLCYLEGLTHEEAAARLGWPVGTVRSRLARARDRLRQRLTGRGLALSAPAFVTVLAANTASATLPPARVEGALLFVAGRDTAGSVSPNVLSLVHGVNRAMFLNKLIAAGVFVLAAGLAVAAGVSAYLAAAETPRAKESLLAGKRGAGDAGADRTSPGEGALAEVKVDAIAWGKAVDKLQPGIRFAGKRRAYRIGETVRFEVIVRNVGTKRIEFSHLQDVVMEQGTNKPVAGMFHEFPPTVVDHRGKKQSVGTFGEIRLGRVPVRKHSLGVRETAIIGRAVLALRAPDATGAIRGPTLIASPGAYKVSQTFSIQRRPGVNESLTTGALPLRIVAGPATPADDSGSWSKPVNDLQARIALVERPKYNGTRQLVPYLELRNVSSSAYQMKVRCGGGHVKFELVSAEGKVVRDGLGLVRSGPHADPGTIVLPHDSSIRIGMHCTNWGVPKDAPAMIATDSGVWVLRQQEKGKVFLRVTVKGAEVESDDRTWHGEIKAVVKVDWRE